jgi:DNA transposition AAA+ family ATPase
MDRLTIPPILTIKGLLEDKKKQLCLRTRYSQMENSRILQHTLETIFKILFKRICFTVLRGSSKLVAVSSMRTLVMVLTISRRKVKPGKRPFPTPATTSFLKVNSQGIVHMAITTFKIGLKGGSRSIQSHA